MVINLCHEFLSGQDGELVNGVSRASSAFPFQALEGYASRFNVGQILRHLIEKNRCAVGFLVLSF